MNVDIAPGARVQIRDEEWLVRTADPCDVGGRQLACIGVSETVRNREAIFLTEIDEVKVLDPRNTELVPDDSPRFISSLLYLEARLRQTIPTGPEISIGHLGAADPLPFQLQPTARVLEQLRPRFLIADAVGLGKTLEAGILVSELMRRGRGRRILVVTTKSMMQQFQKEFWTRFSIPLTRLDSAGIQRIRRLIGYRPELLFDERRRREFWNRALTRKPDDVDYHDSFYRAEFERVVLPQGCESAEDYMKASRVGRGKQLSRLDRQRLWPVFAEYRSRLRAANFREPEEAYRDALALIKKEGTSLGIHSIIIDETQDLSPAALALLRASVPQGKNDIFLVGDAHQRIYRHRASLSKMGIDIRGRGRRLRINYRTTDEIRKWAAAQLANCLVDDLDGQPDTLVGYKSLTHGPKPDDGVVESREVERKAIADTLKSLEDDGIKEKSTCIVVRTNEEAIEYAEWLEGIGKSVLRLERDVSDDQNVAGVRVATMHRVKGLEFDAVIIAGYRGPEHWAKIFAEEADAGAFVDVLTSERCLLHVAATRAKKYLMARKLAA